MKKLKKKVLTRKWSLWILGIVVPMFLSAQTCKYYTLDKLILLANERYPYASQLGLVNKQNNESLKSIDTQWLPHASALIKSSYQSEISSIDIPKNIEDEFGININGGKKLQYQSGISLSQLIYDGGSGHIQKKISGLNGDVQTQQVKSSMLQVEDNIDNLFETILILKAQIKIVQFKQTDLELRKKDISWAIQNGISLKTDMQEIEASIIQLGQQETELRMSLCQKYVELSSFVQEPIDTAAVFELPQSINLTDKDYSMRPDYKIFGLQLQNANWRLKELNSEIFPRLSLFANGYYGRPGLNMMDYTSHYSGIVGVSLTWNIDALYNNTHRRNLVNIDKEMTKNRQSIYQINMDKQIDNLKIDLSKNQKLADSDEEVVKIRSSIKEVASIQLKNGTLTLTDYLIKLNDEGQAMTNKSIHRIEYLMDSAKMKTLLNKNN